MAADKRSEQSRAGSELVASESLVRELQELERIARDKGLHDAATLLDQCLRHIDLLVHDDPQDGKVAHGQVIELYPRAREAVAATSPGKRAPRWAMPVAECRAAMQTALQSLLHGDIEGVASALRDGLARIAEHERAY